MVIEVWRLTKAEYADSAYSGDGAAIKGGRWNSRGRVVVYTSATRSLAALEVLVHLNPRIKLDFVSTPARFDEQLVEYFPTDQLPPNWRDEPAPESTKTIGDQWIFQARSVVLGIPSVIVPGELNFLLNPRHPDFNKVRIGDPEPFDMDSRLVK